MNRDPLNQISTSQARLVDSSNTANNWVSGISSNYRTYDPSSSRFPSVATTRSSAFDPQQSFKNFHGTGRYSNRDHWYANSSQITTYSTDRLSYLAPSASRPNIYYYGQQWDYLNAIKADFVNQTNYGLNFYRLSNKANVVHDQFTNSDQHWIYYNHLNLDNNLLTLSSAGAISKIESTVDYQENTTTPTTPLLFQTHGGMGGNSGGAMVTDYARDSYWRGNDRDTYIWYRPNFGSNVQLPTSVETEGEWYSNWGGQRSGS